MPRPRNISRVRMWKNAARGSGELAARRSMVSERIPCCARNAAAERPTKPPPAIRTGASSVILSCSRPAPADHECFVVEPQTAVLLQDRLGCFQIGTGLHHRIETLVLDLIDIDGSVPGCIQRRGADAIADLRGQGVHLVTKDGLVVGLRVEGKLARLPAELRFERRDQFM